MPPYKQLGSIPRKRHIAHPQQPGYRGEGIYYEEVISTAGFGRAYGLCYHLRPPASVRKVEPAGTVQIDTAREEALRHLAEMRCAELATEVNHDAQCIPHYRQIREDACCPEQPRPGSRSPGSGR